MIHALVTHVTKQVVRSVHVPWAFKEIKPGHLRGPILSCRENNPATWQLHHCTNKFLAWFACNFRVSNFKWVDLRLPLESAKSKPGRVLVTINCPPIKIFKLASGRGHSTNGFWIKFPDSRANCVENVLLNIIDFVGKSHSKNTT